MNTEKTRSVFVSIIGIPNTGKSSLLNCFLGQKIAIVTNKPQTTRTKITGILTEEDTQFVFLDTPGFHKPRTKLGAHMVKAVRESVSSVSDVDIAVLVTPATGKISPAELELLENLRTSRMPVILAVNKIDILSHKELMMEKIKAFSEIFEFEYIIPISALNGEGVDILKEKICCYAVEGPHFFPDDALTDKTEKFIMSEIIREKLLLNMREEIPHGIAVEIEKMREKKKIMNIEAVIYCEKDSHKGMIIGKNGSMLKKVASEARLAMEEFLEIKVNLQCWVKVRSDWRNREFFLKDFK